MRVAVKVPINVYECAENKQVYGLVRAHYITADIVQRLSAWSSGNNLKRAPRTSHGTVESVELLVYGIVAVHTHIQTLPVVKCADPGRALVARAQL